MRHLATRFTSGLVVAALISVLGAVVGLEARALGSEGRAPATVLSTGTYEETDPGIGLSDGRWTAVRHSKDSGGGAVYATQPSTMTTVFVGTSVKVISRKTPNAGVAQVKLNGELVGEFDMYAPSVVYQSEMWSTNDLPSGEHTLTVSWTDQRNPMVTAVAPSVTIDAVVVFDRGGTSPIGLTGQTSSGHAELGWTPAASFVASSFGILRRSGAEEWVEVGSAPGDTASFVYDPPEKGLPYEYAVVARDRWGNESDPSNTAQLTVGVAAGVGTYEEDDAQLSYTGAWVRTKHSRDSGGASSYATAGGASVSMTFTGAAVSLVGRRTSSSGFARVFIDDVQVGNIDRYSPTTQYQQVLWSSSTLSAGEHTIRVEWSDERNAAVASSALSLSFDSFVVPATEGPASVSNMRVENAAGRPLLMWTPPEGVDIGVYRVSRTDTTSSGVIAELPGSNTSFLDQVPPRGEKLTYSVIAVDTYGNVSEPSADVTFTLGSTAGVGTYQEDSSSLRLAGEWVRTTHSADSGAASAYALKDASATLMFTGSSVRWISRTGPKSGAAQIFVDGVYQATVDRYSATNAYQQTVWETTALSTGPHRLDIVWVKESNEQSSGASLVVDAIVVPPASKPPAPAGLSVEQSDSGAKVSWTALTDRNVTALRLQRESGAGVVQIAEFPATQRSYLDLGLPRGETFRYRLLAVDQYGIESDPALSHQIQISGNLPAPIARADQCPMDATVVETAAALKNALAAAGPGTAIRLAPGEYEGSFVLAASGEVDQPIWVCGSADSIIRPGTLVRGTGLYVSGSHIVIAGLAISQSLKGVMVVGARNVTLADLTITDIGDEAVHFRNSTQDSVLVGSTIARTGLTNPGYGEGVYLGTSSGNWCLYNECQVDRSDRVSVLWNSISETTAEAIEVKEGVSGARIYGNTVDARGRTADGVASAIQLKGNSATVLANRVTTDRAFAFRTLYTASGWGAMNVIGGNRGEMLTPEGTMFYLATKDNLVKCDNTSIPSGAFGATCVH